VSVHHLADMPAGTRVRVAFTDGTKARTRTRSDAWQLHSGQWVVLLHGLTGSHDASGAFPLDAVEPIDWWPQQ
jgi:hypothetical protein